MDNCLKQLCR